MSNERIPPVPPPPAVLVPPTPGQQRVLDYLHDQALLGNCPTVRELMAHFNYKSTNSASAAIRALEAGGWIRRDRGRARNLILTGVADVAHRNREIVKAALLWYRAPDKRSAERALLKLGRACNARVRDGVEPEEDR